MIDDIQRHLIKELAADSDLGTSAESFESIIESYHSKPSSSTSSKHQQKVDSNYVSFLWKTLLKTKSDVIQIGKLNPKIPELISKAQDFIEMKNGNTKRLGQKEDLEQKKKLKFIAGSEKDGEIVHLFKKDELIGLRKLSWEELKVKVGDSLRILIEPNKCKEILLGSTDLLSIAGDQYETLKIVTRSRAEGISSVAIAWSPFLPKPQTQSGVFAYVKALEDKGLVHKLAVGSHGNLATVVISKAYLQESSIFTKIKANSTVVLTSNSSSSPSKLKQENEELEEVGSNSIDPLSFLPSRACFDEQSGLEEEEEHEPDATVNDIQQQPEGNQEQQQEMDLDEDDLLELVLDDFNDLAPYSPTFIGDEGLDYDDAKSIWEFNKGLVRLRCLKLVQLSKDGVCVRANFIRRAGFEALYPEYKKVIHRFTAEMVKDRLLKEGNINISGRQPIRTLLLTELGTKLLNTNPADERGEEARRIVAELTRSLTYTEPRIPIEATLDRQYVEHVASKGASGSTVNAMKATLHGSRHMDRFLDLSQFDQSVRKVMPHLSDTGLGTILEQDKKLKFHRIHTYQTLDTLGFQSAVRKDGGNLMDLDSIRDFPRHQRSDFHQSEEEFETTLKDLGEGKWSHVVKTSGKKAVSRSGKEYKNVDAKGMPIIGRPKKSGPRDPKTGRLIHGTPSKSNKKQKLDHQGDIEDGAGGEEEEKQKKGKGKGKGKQKEKESEAGPSTLKRKATSSGNNSDDEVEELMGSDEELEELLGQFPDRTFDIIIDSPETSSRKSNTSTPAPPSASKTRKAIKGSGPASKRARNKSPEPESASPSASTANARSRMLPTEDEDMEDSNETKEAKTAANSTPARASNDSTSMPPPSSKGPKTYIKANKINITRIKRLKVCEQFFEEQGGVVSEAGIPNAWKEFVLKHPDVEEGEPGSTKNGFLYDRKTRHSLFEELVSDGKLKRTELFPENDVDEFLAPSSLVVVWHVPGANSGLLKEVARKAQVPHSSHSRSLVLTEKEKKSMKQRIKNHVDFESLLKDSTITDDISGLYPIACQARGHISGAIGRRRLFHLEVMRLIESQAPPVLSPEKGILDMSYFWSECPLHIFIQFVNPLEPSSPALIQALDDPQRRLWPVDLQSKEVLDALRPDRGMKLIKELARDLSFFRFARPATQADVEEGDDFVLTSDTWRFSFDEVSVFPVKGNHEVLFAGKFPLRSRADAEVVWKNLERGKGEKAAPDQLPGLSKNANRILRQKGAWGPTRLFGVQIYYIERCLEDSNPRAVLKDPALVRSIADGCGASRSMVKRFLLGRKRGGTQRDRLNTPPTSSPPPAGAGAEDEDPSEKEEEGEDDGSAEAQQLKALKSAKRRAKKLKKQRIKAWDDGLENAFVARSCTDQQQEVINKSLTRFRQDYIMGRTKLSDEELTSTFTGAMDAATQVKKGVGDLTRKQLEDAKKRKENAKSEKRAKIEWTPALDELLHDSVVILKARDKQRGPGTSTNWAALRQVMSPHFPNSSLDTFRRRFYSLADEVGEEAYLQNLQDQWTKIWKKHRGTDALPDPDPSHPTEFSLPTHLEFFRQHVRKDLAEAAMKKSAAEPLPGSDEAGMEWQFPINPPELAWEGVFKYASNISVASRFNLMSDIPFTVGVSSASSLSPSSPQRRNAENVIKMIIQTDEADYSEESAYSLIQDVGEILVASTTEKMLEDGIIESVGGRQTENRRLPGRNYRLSDRNPAVEEVFRREILLGASTAKADLKSKLEEEEPLLIGPEVEDAQVAALLDLVNFGDVSPSVDLRDLQSLLGHFHINTRSMSDEDNELPLFFQNPTSSRSTIDASLISAPPPPPSVLSLVDEAKGDFIRLNEILEERWSERQNPKKKKGKNQIDQDLIKVLKSALEKAGEEGLDLVNFRAQTQYTHSELISAIQSLTSDSAQLAFYEGLDQDGNPRLISSKFLKSWVLRLPNSNEYVSPRAWFDMEGSVLESSWQKAVESVIMLIAGRPGILLSHVITRLSSRYTPQEVREAVEASSSTGVVKIQKDDEGKTNLVPSEHWTIQRSS